MKDPCLADRICKKAESQGSDERALVHPEHASYEQRTPEREKIVAKKQRRMQESAWCILHHLSADMSRLYENDC